MKQTLYRASVAAAAFLLPAVTFAQGVIEDGGGPFGTLLENIITFTNGVLIPFVIGIGFLFFVWGMFQFFIAGGANDEAKEKGKSLMVYATLGFVLIVIFWGVINLIAGSTGLQDGDAIGVVPNEVDIGG